MIQGEHSEILLTFIKLPLCFVYFEVAVLHKFYCISWSVCFCNILTISITIVTTIFMQHRNPCLSLDPDFSGPTDRRMDRQKEGKPIVPSDVNTNRGLLINTLCIYQSYSIYSKISNTCLIQKRYRQTEQTQIRLPLAVWSGSSLFAILTCILWISVLQTNILFENRTKSVRNIRTFTAMQKKSCNMRFPTMWYVQPAKAQTSLHICAVLSEHLLVTWIFYNS